MSKYKSINEAIQNGDFSSFNKLNEEEQLEAMKNWTHEMRVQYLSQNSIDDDVLFDEIYKIIDEDK